MPKFINKKLVRRIIFGAVVLLLIWFFFIKPKQLTAMVRRVPVENRTVSRTVSASGLVKSDDQTDLSFLSAGKVAYVRAEKGDVVTKGQLLGYLDTSVQTQTAQSYKDARDIAIRNKELFEEDRETNINTLGGEDEYDIKLRQLDELISQAEASYQAQLGVLSNSYIYAPFDGTIVDVYKKVGEVSVAGEPVVTLATLKNFVFEISIDQEDYGLIKKDLTANIELDSYDNYKFKTSITKLPIAADPASGSFKIEIPISEDENHKIAIGMLGDAFIDIVSSGEPVKSLTIDEIFYDIDDNPYVWVVENGKLKKLLVELGIEGDIYTEIKTDVSEVYVPANDSAKITEGYTAVIIN